MKLIYKNKALERAIIAVNISASAVVVASFIALFGFHQPLISAEILYSLQYFLLFAFVVEKLFRGINAVSPKEYLKNFWFEIPLFMILVIVLATVESESVKHSVVGAYLIFQVVIKSCRSVVSMAATGVNPTRTLLISFLVLILSGAGLLLLPRASTGSRINFIDSLFTATSAACVTGLVVKDIGKDFTLMGQVVIITLIQLGGLGIVVFGAVFAMLLGQALNVRESVAMQDLLSAGTLNRISRMIAFVFGSTLVIESVGALLLYNMWDDVPGKIIGMHNLWFFSFFHSISAFCNAGFSLCSDNLMSYSRSWQVYGVICPLIVFGGFGFGVLYDLASIALHKIKLLFSKKNYLKFAPRRMTLQSKIVLMVTAILIFGGAFGIYSFEHYTGQNFGATDGVGDAVFQSVTARTAGFNTIDISKLSPASKFLMIILMLIGGSPSSTAGGIKTVTFAVLVMTVIASLRRRREVEIFKRSIRLAIVGRAVTVTSMFIFVLFSAVFGLCITERASNFALMDMFFEAASALGTVGLSTGITGSLTAAGKLIIILEMLIGRLGPLTLLASLTFDIKPAQYNYPEEAIIVG